MKYQLQVDNRSVGYLRDSWEEAAWDAVVAGYAVWLDKERISLDKQASIARLRYGD